ncbi:MAG: 6-bladed beta-propeller [Chitinophagaceae bacterium]
MIYKKQYDGQINIKKNRISLLITGLQLLTISYCQLSSAQEVQKIRIDPAQAYGGNVSEYFDSIEYIPLESKKESLFGDVSNLIITDYSIVIYDYDTQSLLFFNLKGSFIRKIQYKPMSSIGLSFIKDQNSIIASVYDPNKRKTEIKQYTPLGESKSDQVFNKIKEVENSNLIPMGGNYYLISGNCFLPDNKKINDTVYHMLNIYKNDSLYKSFIPFSQQKNLAASMIRSYMVINQMSTDGFFYTATPLDFYVYKVSRDNAKVAFKFIFPYNRALTEKDILSQDRKHLNSIKMHLSLDETTILGVSNIFYYNDLLFFKLDTRVKITRFGSESKYQYNFIYNIKNKKLVSMERLNPDEGTCFLPIFDKSLTVNGIYRYGDKFYTSISALSLFSAKTSIKDKEIIFPKSLTDFFYFNNRKSNPVIIRMKVKSKNVN